MIEIWGHRDLNSDNVHPKDAGYQVTSWPRSMAEGSALNEFQFNGPSCPGVFRYNAHDVYVRQEHSPATVSFHSEFIQCHFRRFLLSEFCIILVKMADNSPACKTSYWKFQIITYMTICMISGISPLLWVLCISLTRLFLRLPLSGTCLWK